MMDDPLRRKMFRQAGMSKQPTGILASSPELMGAVKGYANGGLNIGYPYENIAEEFTDEIRGKNPTIQIPMYGQMKPRTKSNIEIEGGLGQMENMAVAEDFGETKDTTPVDVFRNPAIDSEIINNQNKKILNSKTEEEEEKEEFDAKNLMPFGKNLGIRGKTESAMSDDPSLIKARDEVNNSIDRVARAKANNLKDIEIAGTTYNKAIEDLTKSLNEEGREIGLADVYDEGVKLLQFDPKKLDERFEADKRQAFWFNLINAGLQVAAGESPNALTNIAKGLSKGLQGFGKDVGELKEGLREDRKEATNVMYRLLNNKRSEQLAKEALELSKKNTIFQIVKTEVGEKKQEAIAAANLDFEKKKFNLEYLIELKKYDQKEKLSENQIKGALRNIIINNKAISVPFMLGLITPNEGYTMDTVDIANPNTYTFTAEGMKIAKDIYDNTKTYKPTNREQIKKENKGTSTGPAGIVFNKPEKNDGTLATNWAQNINSQFVKDVSDNPENAAKLLLDHVSQYKEQGAQIDLNKLKGLYPEIHNYFISNKKGEDEIEIPNSSPLVTNSDLFKTTKTIDLSKK